MGGSLLSEAGVGQDQQIGFVRLNYQELVRTLKRKGKAPSALRAVVAGETLTKVKRGEYVKTRVAEKILVQVGKWPDLEHADLIERASA